MAFSPVPDSITELAELQSPPLIYNARYRQVLLLVPVLRYREGPTAAFWSTMAGVHEHQSAGGARGRGVRPSSGSGSRSKGSGTFTTEAGSSSVVSRVSLRTGENVCLFGKAC